MRKSRDKSWLTILNLGNFYRIIFAFKHVLSIAVERWGFDWDEAKMRPAYYGYLWDCSGFWYSILNPCMETNSRVWPNAKALKTIRCQLLSLIVVYFPSDRGAIAKSWCGPPNVGDLSRWNGAAKSRDPDGCETRSYVSSDIELIIACFRVWSSPSYTERSVECIF